MENNETQSNERDSSGWWWALMILLTIAILAVTILVPNFLKARAGGKYTECLSNLKNIGMALEMYADENEKNYPTSLTLLTPDYLHTIPTCPSSWTNRRYIDSYRVSKDFKAYTYYCIGDNHSTVHLDKNYPQYNSIDGLIAK